ncbi:MAG: hypothetical protein MIO93_10270 [ANME-2 cluster archaeon]|jgi:uncharacterized protein with HEPN domain|nr:hypothetical protein [ANME-2 cluster archaeon]
MYDATLLLEKLEQIDEALAGIEWHFPCISSPDDFIDSENGLDLLEKITITLISIAENFKKMDRDTKGKKLAQRYPDVNWSGIKGVGDILSREPFYFDAEEIFHICANDMQPLRTAVQEMITELKNGYSP